MNTLEIFNSGYENRAARKYFKNLYQQLIEDFKIQGFSEWIDWLQEELYSKRLKTLDVVDFSVLTSVKSFYDKKNYEPYLDGLFIPNIVHKDSKEGYEWSLCTEHNAFSLQIAVSLRTILKQILKGGREAHLAYLEELKEEAKAKETEAAALPELPIPKNEFPLIQSSAKNSVLDILNLQDSMCKTTNRLQADCMKAMNSFSEQMTALKKDFYDSLHKWQSDLYPQAYKPLAERYIELHRMLNIEKIIAKQLEDKNVPAETSDMLSRLNRNLSLFLKRFEQALLGIGLLVYYPKRGDVFNEVLHNCSSAVDIPENAKIVQCLIPGILKISSIHPEGDVVVPAVVKINK